MRKTRIYELKQTGREQRDTINALEIVIKNLKKQHSEAILSLYYRFIKISNIGHSNDTYKNMKMTDIADKTIKELYEDVKEDLYLENDEEGKIIELVNEYEAKH